MDTKEIQSLIDETIYDFGTIEYSIENGRIKETIPVMRQILTRIQSFERQASAGPDKFKGIFKDINDKINELAQQQGGISEKDLEAIEYQRFIKSVRSWSYDNIYSLRQIIKTPRQKTIESVFIALSAFVLGGCLAAMIFLCFFVKDWGLEGDFYRGQNFERYVASGYNKTINFKNNSEMNPQMPYEHSSARWHGFLVIPQDGTYTLSLAVDDGARLFIDGQLLIDAWKDNDSVEYQNKIFLSKGRHSLRLDYYNDLFDSILKLNWQFEGGKEEVIPAWFLRHKV